MSDGAAAYRGPRPGWKGTPWWQVKHWRYSHVDAEPQQVGMLDAFDALDPESWHAVRLLCENLLADADTNDAPARWYDRKRGEVLPLGRSAERAAHVEAAWATISSIQARVATAIDRGTGREEVVRVLAEHGQEIVRESVWGIGVDIAPVGTAAFAEFPEWIVRKYVEHMRGILEFRLERRLTEAEVATIVRDAAEERLRGKQNMLLRFVGVDLKGYESARRRVRRRRQAERYQRTHTRIAPRPPTLQERILDVLAWGPAGVNAIAKVLRVRKQHVSAAVAALKNAEPPAIVGKNGAWQVVPETVRPKQREDRGVRVATDEVTIGDGRRGRCETGIRVVTSDQVVDEPDEELVEVADRLMARIGGKVRAT